MPDFEFERPDDDALRALLRGAVEGFLVLGPDGRVRAANPAAIRMLGSDPATWPPGEAPAHVRALLDAAAHGPASAAFDDRMISATASPYESTGGKGTVVVISDITELVRARERAEAILSSVGDGLIVFAPAGEVTTINPAACEMFGVEPAAVLGTRTTLGELLGETPDSETDARPGATQAVTADRREVTLSHPQRRIVLVRRDPVSSTDGADLGYVVTLHDVTAERDSAQMKNEFVSTVSHELRTPLTSIKGYIDLILDGDAGPVDEIQREFLEIVKENTDRLVQLINDMLDISRIESGRIHLKIQPLDIAESIAGAVGTFRAVAGQEGHVISVDVPGELPQVAGDRDRVGQVLLNFISNAIKYSPGGGSVTVSAHAADGQVVVSVADEGIGIAEEDIPKLFTQFFRVDSSMTREIGGTGLGLSICKSIIELLGGSVSVETVLGKGSAFSFSLPVAGPDLVPAPEIVAQLETTSGKVLVVDSDTDVAALIETYLSRHGYDVVKAYSAAEALRKATDERPDVITLDVMLQDTDGFELLQKFKDDPITASIPVVILTVVCDEGKSCRLGAANYLEKPIDKSRLITMIDGLLGSVASPLVLVVDDDRAIVDVLTRTLRSKGLTVAAAYDGEEAMAAIERKKPDLILLDLRMPVMDGYEVIQRVKTDPATKDITIVVMTAYSLDSSRVDILQMTAAQVAKPFEPEGLAERLGELIDGAVFS